MLRKDERKKSVRRLFQIRGIRVHLRLLSFSNPQSEIRNPKF